MLDLKNRQVSVLALLAVLAVLLTGCGGAQTSQPAEQAQSTGPKVNRLVFAIGPPSTESNRTAVASTLSYWQLNPMYEYLLGVSVKGEEPTPQLATAWSLEPDGKSYRFKLRQGTQFHNGKGELTSKDINYTWKTMQAEKAVIPPQVETVRKQIQDVEMVNDYEVVFKLPAPDAGFIAAIGQAENVFPIISKVDGESRSKIPELQDPAIAGSGPYQYVSREQGQYIRFAKIPGEHWRKTAGFPEFEWRLIKEQSTMLALVLSKEAQAAALPPELEEQAVGRGFKGISGLAPGLHTFMGLSGAWLNIRLRTEEKLNPDPKAVYVNPNTPLLDVRVRKALNKAIDRAGLNKAFIKGRGDPIFNLFFHPTRPGWNPDWEKRFTDAYGYDPEAAKKLLAEAGFTAQNPYRFTVRLTNSPYFPAAADMAEAIGNNWRSVGVDVKLDSPDPVAIAAKDRALESDDRAAIVVTSIRQLLGVGIYNSTNQLVRSGIELPEIDRLFEQIKLTLDPVKQAAIWRQLGDVIYDQYATIPLFWLPSDATVDPAIIAEYPFPSSIGGTYTHVEYIVPK